MENPFELILNKLEAIESILLKLQKSESSFAISEVLDINKAAEHLHLSKSAIYKMTSQREIPHFKRGKRLYFKLTELDEWLTHHKIVSQDEIERQATEYLTRKGPVKL